MNSKTVALSRYVSAYIHAYSDGALSVKLFDRTDTVCGEEPSGDPYVLLDDDEFRALILAVGDLLATVDADA